MLQLKFLEVAEAEDARLDRLGGLGKAISLAKVAKALGIELEEARPLLDGLVRSGRARVNASFYGPDHFVLVDEDDIE